MSWLALCCVGVVACDRKTPPPPVIEPPAASQTINGTERLGWDQPAADAVELATIGAGSSRLRAVGPDPGVRAGEKRGIVRGTYALPASTTPSSVVFYRGGLFPAFAGSLLVASEDGRHLLRISLEARPSNGSRASSSRASQGDSSPMDASGRAGINSVPGTTELLLENRVGGLRVVAVGPEGAIYFGTESAIGRLTPDVQ